jgi:drug/metabolite transporter (DMT)-like permease
MTEAAVILVLASGALHATWNFLVKRSGHKVIFFWGMALVGLILMGIPALGFAIFEGLGWVALGFGLGTMALHAVYGIGLTRGYHLGDLSSVYPVSRGIAPAVVPLLAVIIFGEVVSAPAWVGIFLIVTGIYVIHVDSRTWRDFTAPLRALKSPVTRVAIFTGLVISCYSLWDKAGLDNGVHPITLIGFTLIGNVIGLTPTIVRETGRELVTSEWKAHRRSIVAAGVLAPVGYTLVLIALTTSQVAYVAPAREIGIVIGTAMGVLWLGEGYGLTRIWGSVLIVMGAMLLAVAPS